MNADTKMPPDLARIIRELKADIFSNLNCIQIGKISAITSSAQTVEVQLQIKRLAQDGTSIQLPVLVDCPYFILQGGGACIGMPIKIGDYCIVLFNDRDIDMWWSTANVADPNSMRKHSLSDGIALVGLNPSTKVITYDGNAIDINAGSLKVQIKNNAETWATLLSNLIDAIVAIVTVGTATTQTLNPATITALNAIKVRAATLWEA